MNKKLSELIELMVDIATTTTSSQQQTGGKLCQQQFTQDIQRTSKDRQALKTKSGAAGKLPPKRALK